MPLSRGLARLALVAAVTGVLAGCAGVPENAGSSTGSAPDAARTTSAAPTPSASITPFPTGHSVSTTPLPDDCEAILNDRVRAELDGVPLNAPGMGGGIRPDSSRVCVWGDPGAAGTRLVTVIGYSPEREALDALYELGTDEGFTCYEPDGGVRCEKTWDHPSLPVEEGRTLFYRDGVIVDTQFSNLAPAGYTSAIIAALWPKG